METGDKILAVVRTLAQQLKITASSSNLGEEGETSRQNDSPRRTEKREKNDCKKKIVLYFVSEKWRSLQLWRVLLSAGAAAGQITGTTKDAILRWLQW